MKKIFLEVLNKQQKVVFKGLHFLEEGSFYLAGGTALALQLKHRTSLDFDFYNPEHFDPENMSKIEDKDFIYNTAKSIMYCVETQLLMNGIYETKREDMVRRATEELELDDDILNIVRLSQSVTNGDFGCIEDPIQFWFSAKRYTLLVFQQLAERFLDIIIKFTIDAGFNTLVIPFFDMPVGEWIRIYDRIFNSYWLR